MTAPAQTPVERSRPALEGVRWSQAVRCPRAAVYAAQDAPARDWTEQEERYFRRGSAMGKMLADDIVAGFREQGRVPRREVEVEWPAGNPVGVGHMDAYIPHERLAVECFSTAGAALDEVKAVQVAGYALNHPRAERAVVVSIDPHTFEDRTYPIDVAALEPRVREIEAAVVAGVRDGVLPDRVCETPADGFICRFCDHCFQDWERPPLDELLGGRDVLAELADATDQLALVREQERSWKAMVDEGWEKVDRMILPDPETAGKVSAVGGGFEVSVTSFEVERFSLADARKAGHSLDADGGTLAAFQTSSLQRRRKITRLEVSR